MKPDEGEVWLHGELVKGPKSTVGMAFQNPVLLEWRTILQNVMLPLEIVPTKMSKRDQEDRARHFWRSSGSKVSRTNAPRNCRAGCASAPLFAGRSSTSPRF